MKRKFLFVTVIFALLLTVLPACDAQKAGSLKAMTRPYIAQYECISATLGSENLLDKFDYIEVNLADKKELEVIYKLKGGERKIVTTTYEFDTETRELSADIGIFGYRFKQCAKIENGKFTVTKAIGLKQLIMNFQLK
ncbi:MAG: hypothetical protein K2J83_02505 [Clostridia bacterium]|nr:hypothetical protein [Clostridia bacterium]